VGLPTVVPAQPVVASTTEAAPNPWFSWGFIRDNQELLLTALREHVTITVVAVLMAVVVAFPLALLARRYRWLEAPVLSTAGVLYTIPALVVIAVLWPVFGLSPLTVEVALAIYALLILLRNFITGLDGVPADVVDAARGMGFGPRRLLWSVQVPLALPAMLAGVRIATVSTIGLVTIGALVGHGGFGSLIIRGFEDNFYRAEILTATLACVVLALVAELLLLGAERAATPWARRRRAA
jgi:osmoprotectant transport system permease protein